MKQAKKMVALTLAICMISTYTAFADNMGAQMINSNVQYGGDMGKATPRSDIQYYEEYEVIGAGAVIEEGRDFLGSQTASAYVVIS